MIFIYQNMEFIDLRCRYVKFTLSLLLLNACVHATTKSEQIPNNTRPKSSFRSITESRDELDHFIHEVLAKTQIPGLSIAVVEDSKVVFSKGYGLKRKSGSEPLTTDTLMMVGSITKPLTTLMIADLVDKNKLDWQDEVSKIYPYFKTANADLTAKLRIQDMACMCTGLDDDGFIDVLGLGERTPEGLIESFSKKLPKAGFKEKYIYSNQILAAGGYIVAQVYNGSGNLQEAYREQMSKSVFDKLGMKRSTLSIDKVLKDDDFAIPHSPNLFNKHQEIDLQKEEYCMGTAPAGGIWSTVNEMSKFIIVEMNGGLLPNGTRAYSSKNIEYRRIPQIQVNQKIAYGLGWRISNPQGILRIFHTGRTLGYESLLSIFPNKKLGVIILANSNKAGIAENVIYSKLLELWFNWRLNYSEVLESEVKESQELAKKWEQSAIHSITDQDLNIVGHFKSEKIGEFRISKEENDLILYIGTYRSPLLVVKQSSDEKILVSTAPPFAGVTISFTKSGQITLKNESGKESYDIEKMQL